MSDLLIGCRAKIERAEENIRRLNGEITAFLSQESKPYRIRKEFRNNGLQYAFVAFGDPIAPPRFAVLAGEIIHHLRSSLVWTICSAHL